MKRPVSRVRMCFFRAVGGQFVPVTLVFTGDDREEAERAATDYADRTGLTSVRLEHLG